MSFQIPDFDTLKEIAEKDPEALECYRQHLISSAIMDAPTDSRARLRGLQFQIDCQRRLQSTPLAACIKISGMMHDSFYQLTGLLNHFSGHSPLLPGGNTLSQEDQSLSPKSAKSRRSQTATILSFTRH